MANFGSSVTSNSRYKTDAFYAGAAINIGDVVYLDTNTNTWKLAQSNALATLGSKGIIFDMGVALNTAVSGGDLTVVTGGILENCTGLQAGSAYCVSDTVAGDVALLAALTGGTDYVCLVGLAETSAICHLQFINTRALVTANNGTAATNVTALHYGDGTNVTAVLTLTNVALTVGSSASLGVGVLIYTLPTGTLTAEHSLMSVDISGVTTTTDTPDVGLGTTQASGVVAVLGGTPAFENLITGQTAADTNGTPTVADQASALSIATAGAHTVYFNAADAWGANADSSALVNGTVVLKYQYLSA